jgi:hypothetical protein
MLFFINPAHRSAHKRRRRVGLTGRRGRRQTLAGRKARKIARKSSTGGTAMARRMPRRNARGRFVRSSGTTTRRRRRRTYRRNPARAEALNPRRRRRRYRRNAGAVALNPRRRRRVFASRARRRYRRNPGRAIVSARGIVGSIIQGVKDGSAVFAGQVVARKVRGAVTGMLPANAQAAIATGAGQVALAIASAVVTTLGAKQFVPQGYKRLVAAGAFSEAINAVVAQTPVAGFLSAFPARRVYPVLPNGRAVPSNLVRAAAGVAAYPMRPGMRAYPMPRVPQMYSTGG